MIWFGIVANNLGRFPRNSARIRLRFDQFKTTRPSHISTLDSGINLAPTTSPVRALHRPRLNTGNTRHASRFCRWSDIQCRNHLIVHQKIPVSFVLATFHFSFFHAYTPIFRLSLDSCYGFPFASFASDGSSAGLYKADMSLYNVFYPDYALYTLL